MLTVRPATLHDARHLFGWRNDPQTRAMCRDTGVVEWAAHCRWLIGALERQDIRLLMIVRDGEPVATARFDYGDEAEISVTIAPEFRCKGLPLKIAQLAIAQEPGCIAYIKAENTPCQRLVAASDMNLVRNGQLQRWEHHACSTRARSDQVERFGQGIRMDPALRILRGYNDRATAAGQTVSC